jgi:hypothetical protein
MGYFLVASKCKLKHLTERAGVAVKLCFHIQEELSLNLSHDAGSLPEVFICFPQSLQENVGLVH